MFPPKLLLTIVNVQFTNVVLEDRVASCTPQRFFSGTSKSSKAAGEMADPCLCRKRPVKRMKRKRFSILPSARADKKSILEYDSCCSLT